MERRKKMLIEVVIFIGIIGVFLLGSLFLFITKFIKLRRYKPENDKGRCAEESRRRELAVVQRPVLPERRDILPTTDVSPPRQDSTSSRKLRFFKRRKVE
jgi:hypothetical protein